MEAGWELRCDVWALFHAPIAILKILLMVHLNYNRKNLFDIVLILSFLLISCSFKTAPVTSKPNELPHKKYFVQNIGEFNAIKPRAGDTIIMKNGEWKNAQLVFKANGTQEQPAVLTAETRGKVELTGNSNLKIDGQWLVVDGMSFNKGFSVKDDVILFAKSSSDCRLTNTSIINYNPPLKATEYKWLSLYGKNHVVDHCEFTGKNHQGATLVVWLSETPNDHKIQNNYFGPRPPLGQNGGETIRIGTSDWSMYDSRTLVENNIFDRCDGEIEIISVKSCKNVISNNLFYECAGTLTLRHGNDNLVEGNYFIGNDKQNTGGIRVIGENHIIRDNYLYKLAGSDYYAAISVLNALKEPKLNEYWQVKNAVIEKNILVKPNQALVIGAGHENLQVLPPDSLAISGNYVLSPTQLLLEKAKVTRFIVKDNQVHGAQTLSGFSKMAENTLKKDAYGIWQLQDHTIRPFWLSAAIGPKWKTAKLSLPIK